MIKYYEAEGEEYEMNDKYVTFEIGKTKHIALVAHDGKKKELVEWCDKNKEILKWDISCAEPVQQQD